MSRNRLATVPNKRLDCSNAPLTRRGIVDGCQRTDDLRTYNQEYVGEPAKERHVRVESLAAHERREQQSSQRTYPDQEYVHVAEPEDLSGQRVCASWSAVDCRM